MASDRHSSGLILGRSFSEKLDEAAGVFNKTSGLVRVITHYDPDGMSAAAILSKTVRRADRQFQTTLTSKLDVDILDSVKEDAASLLILADIGGGNIDDLGELGCPVIVLDHHASENEGDGNVIHVNPHFFGIEGAKEISGSTLALAFAATIDQENWDLATLAIAGAVGDRQNLGGFKGVNEDILLLAVKKDLIKAEKTLDLRGEAIFESLMNYPEPYFKGLNGNKRAINKIMKELAIDETTKIKDLEDSLKRRLTSVLAMHLLKQGATPEAIDQLVTNRFWLYDWGIYADEFAALLNACARKEKLGLGLSTALGSKESMEEARAERDKHMSWILKNMQKMEKNPPEATEHIQYFHIDDRNYTGVIGGLCTLYIFDKTKPTFGLFKGKKELNVSARAPRALVENGLDLGAACKTAAEKCGGVGGGHNIASGAKVPVKKEKKFLEDIEKIVAEQLSG